ncbi:hypothetical protein PIROE2DRAFT_12090 [Piromyces sp. E2]|nr:hypothetical protein PIROE2DRAFT_12090 [Piromyces sp. E2]|eukprot:OUM61787.1 hypothetical protein PIROE2DRAFT_12090 [Piromyces sp. E2]
MLVIILCMEKSQIFKIKYGVCTECAENASLINNVCQCNNNYSGLGYIQCSKGANSLEEECNLLSDIIGNYIYCCSNNDIICENDRITYLHFNGTKFENSNILQSIGKFTELKSL